MRYRLTLLDAPPDSPLGGPQKFEAWEDVQEQVWFVVTRAKRRWSAIAIEQWPLHGGKWVLDGYATNAVIEEIIAKEVAEAEEAEASRYRMRSRIWRALRQGCGKARKDWERKAMTRTGESLARDLARAAARGYGMRLTAQEVLRLQNSTEVISPSVRLVKPKEERCCLCGLDYGERDEEGGVIPFESLCAHCSGDVKDQRREKRRQAAKTTRATAPRDAD